LTVATLVSFCLVVFSSYTTRSLTSSLFPYTTLFRSVKLRLDERRRLPPFGPAVRAPHCVTDERRPILAARLPAEAVGMDGVSVPAVLTRALALPRCLQHPHCSSAIRHSSSFSSA